MIRHCKSHQELSFFVIMKENKYNTSPNFFPVCLKKVLFRG